MAAATELRRAVTKLGCVGGYLSVQRQGPLPRCRGVCADLRRGDRTERAAVRPSAQNPPARERTGKYELAVVAGYLFDTTLNVFHMIFGGLFDRYPTLRMCCTHLGGYAPLLHARMQRELDTNPALAATLKRPLRDYFRALYFNSICFEPSYARAALEPDVVNQATCCSVAIRRFRSASPIR